MTIQQLKYILTAAEKGSITEAARALYISQPSLSSAIREVEKEAGLSIFNRCRTGIAPTKEGLEFLGYARQVLQQMELLESRYTGSQRPKQRFCISTQHYTFTANAFLEDVKKSLAAGMDAHISKPLDIDKVLSTIDSLARGRQA